MNHARENDVVHASARRASMHDRVVFGAVDDQEAGEPVLDARERVIDDGVATGALNLEVHDGSAAGRNRHRLNAHLRGREQAAARIDVIENLADYVIGRSEVRAADAEVNADGFADACAQGMRLGERADRAVEEKIFRPIGASSLS